MRHPCDLLFPGEKPFPSLPAVDHYAGSEKLMRKALQLQNELGPVFDITCDCEGGAHGTIPGSAMKSPGQFDHPLVARAKCEITSAALANGVIPTHNVTTELKDLDVIRNDARRARNEFGYLRMWSIHPNQIIPIVEAMRPDFSEVKMASAILIAAQDKDWAPIAHEGRLHDRASYRYYWELLERAQATGMSLPDAAQQRFFG